MPTNILSVRSGVVMYTRLGWPCIEKGFESGGRKVEKKGVSHEMQQKQ